MSVKRNKEFPSEVKVLWAKYDILFEKDIYARDGDKCLGLHEYPELRIHIDNSYSIDEQRVNLLHEVFHSIDLLQGLQLEENQVRGLAHGLRAVMKENPKVRDFIFRDK